MSEEKFTTAEGDTKKGVSRETPFSGFSLDKRTIVSKSSSARVIHFHYLTQYPGRPSTIQSTDEANELAARYLETETNILEDEIESIKVSKSLDNPSGNFSIQLRPMKNWKKVFAPGDWLCIYLFKNQPAELKPGATFDSTNLVLVGNVDRVSRSVQRDEDASSDKVKLSYTISGRNFGKVFEETEIWYDPYVEQMNRADVFLRTAGLEVTGNPTSLVTKVLDVFLGQGSIDATTKTKTSPLKQWRIPLALASLFGIQSKDFIVPGVPLFFDILKNNINQNLPGYKERQMLNMESNGSVWDMVKRSCNQLVNELFLEEVRDNQGRAFPTVTLRPRPIQTPYFKDLFRTQPPKPVDPKPKDTTYVIVKGDTLGRIANKNKTTVKILQGLNPKISNPDLIYTGDTIIVKREEPEKPVQQQQSDKILDWLKGAYESLQDLSNYSFVEISPVEVTYEDVGKEDHTRFNMFWLDTTNHYEHVLSQVSNLVNDSGIANPMFYRDSVQRHGLKRMQSTLEFCHASGDGVSFEKEINLFKAFSAQIIDQNYVNHLYDTGTIECAGVLEAEIGKCMILLPEVVGSKKKLYYIQGYEHSWKFPKQWTTSFTVTHGQFKDPNIFIDLDNRDRGSDDENLRRVYLAKTDSKKGLK